MPETPDRPHPQQSEIGSTLSDWAALIAHWTEAAKSVVALPTEGEAGRYRDAVGPAIGLQAVACALADLDRLADPADRLPAQDKAEILIRTHAAEMHRIWTGEPLPEIVEELIADAAAALDVSRTEGVEWTVSAETATWEHPADLVAALLATGFSGDLLLPSPGHPLFETSPAAFIRDAAGGAPSNEHLAMLNAFMGPEAGDIAQVQGPRQVYRQFDFSKGGPVRDLVLPMDDHLPPGQPLLVLAIDQGNAMPISLPPRGPVRLDPIPVEFPNEAETGDPASRGEA